MCGIAGVLYGDGNKETINTMLAAQSHRGPDNTETYVAKDIQLGHNRLSIIDPTSNSNQPFFSPNNRYVLVYNGEIYNYLELREQLRHSHNFVTQSDTEVLLAAYMKWGKDCLDKFNGMFSFAIWDSQKKQLFAARDRFGVKPFYYANSGDSFYFASEIKTLFKAGVTKTPKDTVWANYFSFGSYGMPNETFWVGVEQLAAGHYMEICEGKLELHKWYDFETEVKVHSEVRPFNDVLVQYEELLKDSIKLRFRSDVPVGFNLSGGLDSSTLLAFVNASEERKKINAYTFYTNDPNYDELPWVEDMIALTKNPLHKVLLQADEVITRSEEISHFQDEPFGGVPTLAYSKIFKKAREQGVKVLLDGQGMDEQWAGYDYYTKNSNSVIQGVKKSPFRAAVLSQGLARMASKPVYRTPFNDSVQNLQYRDLFYTKIPRALRFNDRVSMAASTELREPFLDYRMVELAFAQPLEYKIQQGTQKYMLRILVSKHLSDSIRYAPKRPLQTPQREWLGDDLRDWVFDTISHLKKHHWFNEKELDRELLRYFEGDRESSFHIWQWLNTSLLLKG